MKDSVESKLGLFFAFAIIALLIVLEFAGGLFDVINHYELHALFHNVQELKKGDPVKMAGVPVGRVENITLVTNGLADVKMNLQKDADVRVDSKASIKFTGLMAQDYVEISFGVDPIRLENGKYLQAVEPTDLGELMGKLDKVATGVENLTKSFSGDQIDNLLGPIRDFLKNNSGNLSATITNIKTTTDRIVAGQGTLGMLINTDALHVAALDLVSNLENSATNIQGLADQAHSLVININGAVSYVKSGEGTIGKLYKYDTFYTNLNGSMTNLHHILIKIDDGQGTVGQLINDDSTLKNIKISLQKLDKATESLEDTGPLSVLGTMATTLF